MTASPPTATTAPHDTQANKRLMQSIFDALAEGNGRPMVDAMADDFAWIIPGHATWSRTYRGKQVVRDELFKPLFERFATTYTARAHRFIAEEDYVVVETRGDVMTKSGRRYDNTYCMVCRLEGGKLRELTEYMDTELAADVLGAP